MGSKRKIGAFLGTLLGLAFPLLGLGVVALSGHTKGATQQQQQQSDQLTRTQAIVRQQTQTIAEMQKTIAQLQQQSQGQEGPTRGQGESVTVPDGRAAAKRQFTADNPRREPPKVLRSLPSPTKVIERLPHRGIGR